MSVKVGMECMSFMWVWRKKEESMKVWRSEYDVLGSVQCEQDRTRIVFDFKLGQKIKSAIYCDQVLLGLLKRFRNEFNNDILNPIVMEDGKYY